MDDTNGIILFKRIKIHPTVTSSSFCLCLRGRHEGKLREEYGGTVSRVRWMDNRKKATDAGDAGVARAVGDDRQWQMHYQRHLHSPLSVDSHSVPHTHTHTPTNAQTHASELIEASGLAPHEAQGGSDCHPFFLPPSAPYLIIHSPTRNHTCTQIHAHI